MRVSVIASLVAVAVSTVAAQYTNQSAPFNLVVLSANSTINGSTLEACHEGAAIEGLCLSGQFPTPVTSQFTFNTSSYDVTYNATLGEPGILAFELQGGNFNESEPMILSYNPTSNVAVPLFEPSDSGTLVAFDPCGKLNIQGYVDDTTYPPTVDVVDAYYRWYVCTTYAGYTYRTLAWVMGEYPPENPTCVKVDVTRVFV